MGVYSCGRELYAEDEKPYKAYPRIVSFETEISNQASFNRFAILLGGLSKPD